MVIPIRDIGGDLHSLQFIDPEGSERFLTGGRVAGCYFTIETRTAWRISLSRRVRYRSSIHEVTGYAVALAFDAGNLEPATRALREKFPDCGLIVCADDDVNTSGNPGVTNAKAAALAVSGKLAVPDLGADRPVGVGDFND